jgi:hypothetical protein
METPRGCECEHLHERARLAEAPRALVDLGAVDDDREAPEQLERDL